MAFISRTCFLQSVSNKAKRIILPHGKLVTLGRNEETEILDRYLSKKQLECTSNCDLCTVNVKVVGRTISGCNGYALRTDSTYTLKHSDRLEIRLGLHEFEIVFEPPPDDITEEQDEPVTKKAKLDFPIFNKHTTGKQEVKNFTGKGVWDEIDNKELLIYTPDGCASKDKIAAFDMDGTIIKTKSGARFPKDPDDWILLFNDIPAKLTELHDEGFKIVFFTNQSGVGKDLNKLKGFRGKVENIVQKIKLPIQVFIATGRSIYRKPAPGMWNTLQDTKNENVQINIKESFYVGDAAGREKNWAPKKNKDHSLADRLFALNLNLKFYTPEEYFLKSKSVPYIMPEFDPRNLSLSQYPDFSTENQDVIIMVGGPGSGKSFFCKNKLVTKGYVYANRDILGSWQKCAKLLEDGIQQKKNVVVDNTNPDKESRKRFLDITKKYGIQCRCFVMTTSYKHAKHNNRFREITDSSHQQVNDIILNSYKKNFQEPELSEGFSEIIKIPFIPSFEKKDDEKLYKLFLIEN